MSSGIDINQFKSEEARNILTELLYKVGAEVDVIVKDPLKGGKRPELKIVGRETREENNSRCASGENQDVMTGNREVSPDDNRQRGQNLHVVEPSTLQVTVEGLLKYYKHKGVVGEEKNCVLQTLCAANGLSFGVEGSSGSGKTFLVDALIDLLPEKEVYELGLASEQAAFNDSARINCCRFIYIPEIQKAMSSSRNKASSIIELIKNLTEGKDASRVVAVGRGEVAEYRIEAGVTIIYTLALENCFKKDNETARRFIRLMTDVSKEHIDEVMQYKAEERCTLRGDACLGEDGIRRIKEHIKSCIEMPELRYFDPFSLALNEYVPPTPKSIGFINHYYGLLDASAKFHHKNRLFTGEALVLDLEDHYLIQTLYYDEFCRTLETLNKESAGGCCQEFSPKDFDWQRFWHDGISKMREQLPGMAEQWESKQLRDGRIDVYDVPSLRRKVIEIGKTGS